MQYTGFSTLHIDIFQILTYEFFQYYEQILSSSIILESFSIVSFNQPRQIISHRQRAI